MAGGRRHLVAIPLAVLHDRMDAVLSGHAYAKSAIDVACWDVAAKAQGVSVTTLLGGLRNESFPLYVAIPLGAPAAGLAVIFCTHLSKSAFGMSRRLRGVSRVLGNMALTVTPNFAPSWASALVKPWMPDLAAA